METWLAYIGPGRDSVRPTAWAGILGLLALGLVLYLVEARPWRKRS